MRPPLSPLPWLSLTRCSGPSATTTGLTQLSRSRPKWTSSLPANSAPLNASPLVARATAWSRRVLESVGSSLTDTLVHSQISLTLGTYSTASFIRNESPDVTTVMMWWRSRSRSARSHHGGVKGSGVACAPRTVGKSSRPCHPSWRDRPARFRFMDGMASTAKGRSGRPRPADEPASALRDSGGTRPSS